MVGNGEAAMDAILSMYCTPDIHDAVREQPIEAFAFAIGGSMGAVSNARRLFESKDWTAAELMRMELDLHEAINWAASLRELVQNRKAVG